MAATNNLGWIPPFGPPSSGRERPVWDNLSDGINFPPASATSPSRNCSVHVPSAQDDTDMHHGAIDNGHMGENVTRINHAKIRDTTVLSPGSLGSLLFNSLEPGKNVQLVS